MVRLGDCEHLSRGMEKKDWGNFGWKDASKALLKLGRKLECLASH